MARQGLTGGPRREISGVRSRGRLAEFLPVGLNEEEIARIDHWPEGRGRLWR